MGIESSRIQVLSVGDNLAPEVDPKNPMHQLERRVDATFSTGLAH